MRFDELDFEPALLDAIDSMNFQDCTPIQEQAIPHLLKGRDLIGVAQTGTGKTAAYLLPVLDRLSSGSYPSDAINCLIMVPTRELAQQIDQQVEGFSYFLDVSSTAVYGGNDGIRFEQEKRGFAMGTDIVVATPGRLISHISLGNIDLSKVSFFILDEADRMLDMGFYDDIMQIVSQLPKERQNMLFSATMPQEVEAILNKYMTDPVKVAVGSRNSGTANVDHKYYMMAAKDRYSVLKSIIDYTPSIYGIVFCRTKLETQEIADNLIQDGYNAAALHGDLSQGMRDNVMDHFRKKSLQLLIATDVAARGIDVSDLTHIINYNLPDDIETYVHRSGRTGRADKRGICLSLINLREKSKIKKIEKIIDRPQP